MILSHEHKFLFLKTNKTAGTSLEIALSAFCGDRDIITPISREDEDTRAALGYRGPQHCAVPLWRHSLRELGARALKGNTKQFYNHMPARKLRRWVGEIVWRDYYKFCFERNPWDRVVSLYYWRNPQEPRPTMADFVESEALKVLKKRGIKVYTLNGEIAVDRVCLYEDLDAELERVSERLGLPGKLSLPTAKSAHRGRRPHYRELIDPLSRERIAQLFAEEIRLFGYQF